MVKNKGAHFEVLQVIVRLLIVNSMLDYTLLIRYGWDGDRSDRSWDGNCDLMVVGSAI